MRMHTGYRRQQGFIISLEAALFTTIIIMGSIVGWVMIRDSVNAELFDTANVIESTIQYPYFSDPSRGTVTSFTEQTFTFESPSTTESGL